MTETSELGTWVKGSVAPVLASELASFHYQEVQHDRGPTGSLELRGRKGSRKGTKYPRRTLVRETPGRIGSTNVSLPHCGGAVPTSLTSCGPKGRVRQLSRRVRSSGRPQSSGVFSRPLCSRLTLELVVVLPNPLQEMGKRRNSAKTQL